VNELSLFSGYGGFSLGLQLLLGRENVRTVGWCEIEPYCQEILKARFRDGYLDDAPIWPDIRTADFSGLRGMADIVTAGFPCQPHSVAGRRKGESDERNLWPQTCAAIDAVRPRYVALENVPGLLQPNNGEPYVVTVLGDLAGLGYDARWCVVGARDVGAPHRRDRWFCLAYAAEQRWGTGSSPPQVNELLSNRERLATQDSEHGGRRQCGLGPHCRNSLGVGQADSQGEQGNVRLTGLRPATTMEAEPRGLGSGIPQWPPKPRDRDGWARVLTEHPELAPALGDTRRLSYERRGYEVAGAQGEGEGEASEWQRLRLDPGDASQQETQSSLRGVVDGVAHRTHRLKALGNGIVPAQAAYALKLLLQGATA